MNDIDGKPFVENYLAFLLAKTSYLISGGFHQQLQQIGVSISTWRILAAIHDQPRAVGELADIVLLNQSTLSKVLDRLERDGLLTRTRDEANRRVVYIGITEKGSALVNRLIPMANSHESRSFAHLGERQKKELIAILQETIQCNDQSGFS